MKTKLFRTTFDRDTAELLLTGLLVVLLIFCDIAIFAHPGPQPTSAPGNQPGPAHHGIGTQVLDR